MNKNIVYIVVSGLIFAGSVYYLWQSSQPSLAEQNVYSIALEEAFKSNEDFLEKQQKIYSKRAEKAENELMKMRLELDYRDEQIRKLGGEVKTLEDKAIKSSISYLGKTYPIISGWQEDIDEHEVAWIECSAYYKDYSSNEQDMSPKLSVNDNIGLYLAAYSKLDFAKKLRDEVNSIIYTDSKNNQKTYVLTKKIPVESGSYLDDKNKKDKEVANYISGNAGNIISIQTTYDDNTSELLIFEPVEEEEK